jgi:hypothetical protein
MTKTHAVQHGKNVSEDLRGGLFPGINRITFFEPFLAGTMVSHVPDHHSRRSNRLRIIFPVL